MRRLIAWSNRNPWIWAFVGVVCLLIVLSALAGRVNIAALVGALTPAAFLAIVAIGQSFAIASGGGNIDLSIPSVITLSAFVTVRVVAGDDGWAPVGFLLGVSLGIAVGAANALLIVWLKFPAIIATLAMGYVVTTFTLLQNRGALVTNLIAPKLHFVAAGKVAGFPIIALVAVLMAGLASLVFRNLTFGRMILAIGQNPRAAALAGMPTAIVVALAFLISGGLAGATGVLLSAYSGGAFLDMGTNYLLQSVGAVVIGGSPAFGGRVSVAGTIIGSLFLTLLGTVMQLIGLRGGAQEIVQGLVIVAVLAASGFRAGAGRFSKA